MVETSLILLYERLKGLIMKPTSTWEMIRDESVTVSRLWVLLFQWAAIPAISSFFGLWLVGDWISLKPILRLSFGRALTFASVGYLVMVGGVWLLSRLLVALSLRSGEEADEGKALKVVLFSMTPYLAAGILYLYPPLSSLIFIAALYGLYLLFIGLPVVTGIPRDDLFPTILLMIVALMGFFLVVGWIGNEILKPAIETIH